MEFRDSGIGEEGKIPPSPHLIKGDRRVGIAHPASVDTEDEWPVVGT